MKTKLSIFLSAFLLFFLSACGSIPKSEKVPMDLTPVDLTILAQQESDKNNYRGAKAYYQIMIDRYTTDAAVVTAGEFEIAHILIKQSRYEKASIMLKRVLSRFEGASGTMLPQKYRKLAENDLKRIEPKLKKQKNSKLPKDDSIEAEPIK
ncbi:MAG: hypothetical protein CR988_04010 [Treponema sp.]|nr:MAG: hypothetical protein CR988_04010 [Treponema sp.]